MTRDRRDSGRLSGLRHPPETYARRLGTAGDTASVSSVIQFRVPFATSTTGRLCRDTVEWPQSVYRSRALVLYVGHGSTVVDGGCLECVFAYSLHPLIRDLRCGRSPSPNHDRPTELDHVRCPVRTLGVGDRQTPAGSRRLVRLSRREWSRCGRRPDGHVLRTATHTPSACDSLRNPADGRRSCGEIGERGRPETRPEH